MTNPNKKIVLGILGAAAVGATAYMLLAPGKSAELRKKISDNFGDIACRLGDYFNIGKEKIQTV